MVRHILIVAPHLGALTPLANQLQELGTLGSNVHIAVERDAPPGVDVSVFRDKFRRVTIGPAPHAGTSAQLGSTIRAVLDCWRLMPEHGGPAGAYDRALERAPSLAASVARNALLGSSVVRPMATRVLAALDRSLPPPAAIVDFLTALRPELLIVAPLFRIGSSAADYMRAARALNIATFGIPLRWDDLIEGASLHVMPDCLALWNRDDRRRAIDERGVPSRRTAVLGAPLPLDITGAITTTRADLCARYGLDPSRPLVLFAPDGRDERRRESFSAWARAIRCSDACVRGAQPLIYWPPPGGVRQRVHEGIDGVVLPRPGSAPAEYRREIAEALHHADAVVATDMTLVFEAAARARPLLALLAPDDHDSELARFCASEHRVPYWPLVARNLGEHCLQLGQVLERGLTRDESVAVQARVRPHGPTLTPGFLAAVRLLESVVDRRGAATPQTLWVLRRLLFSPLAALVASRAAKHSVRREPGSLARVLIGVPSAETLQWHQALLRSLVERGHRVRVAFTSRRHQTAEYYQRLETDVPGVHAVGVVTPSEGFGPRLRTTLLGLSAFVALLEGRHDRPRWLVRHASAVLPAAARRLAWLAARAPGRVRRTLAALDRAIASSAATRELLAGEAPDVVVMLPEPDLVSGFESAESQADLLRASASLGVPTVALPVAADSNLHATMLQPRPSHVFVWNEAQQEDVIRASRLPRDRVIVTGSMVLEHALEGRPVVDPDQFRELLGLPAGRPFAFFAGSSGPFIEADAEIQFVRRWVDSLRADSRPALRTLPVLLRPPVNRAAQWQRVDFRRAGGVVMSPRQYDDTGDLDTVLLAESVRYAAVTVGFDGFPLILAATLGKPVVAASAVSSTRASASTPTEWLWTAEGTTIRHASTVAELNAQVMEVLDDARPTELATSPFRRHVLPLGTARRATLLVADAIEEVVRTSRVRWAHRP